MAADLIAARPALVGIIAILATAYDDRDRVALDYVARQSSISRGWRSPRSGSASAATSSGSPRPNVTGSSAPPPPPGSPAR